MTGRFRIAGEQNLGEVLIESGRTHKESWATLGARIPHQIFDHLFQCLSRTIVME